MAPSDNRVSSAQHQPDSLRVLAPSAGGSGAVITQKRPEVIRVTRADQSQVVVQRPAVRANTLVGIAEGDLPGDSIYVPLDQIRALETRGGDAGATFGLMLVGAAVSIGTYLLLCDCVANP